MGNVLLENAISDRQISQARSRRERASSLFSTIFRRVIARLTESAVAAQPLAALPPYGCGVPPAQPLAAMLPYGCGVPPAQPLAAMLPYGCGVPLAGIAGIAGAICPSQAWHMLRFFAGGRWPPLRSCTKDACRGAHWAPADSAATAVGRRPLTPPRFAFRRVSEYRRHVGMPPYGVPFSGKVSRIDTDRLPGQAGQ